MKVCTDLPIQILFYRAVQLDKRLTDESLYRLTGIHRISPFERQCRLSNERLVSNEHRTKEDIMIAGTQKKSLK